jgi:hypothetical protein
METPMTERLDRSIVTLRGWAAPEDVATAARRLAGPGAARIARSRRDPCGGLERE